jgi:hypothetical protein
MAIKPFIPYNKRNLNRVSKSILKHLTPDLLPKKYHETNKKNRFYGHCHNASGCLYMFFRSQNMYMYRAYDEKTSKQLNENFYHWWIVDKDSQIIDLTSSQYSQSYVKKLYKIGEKGSILGFDYKKRVKKLFNEVFNDLIGDELIDALNQIRKEKGNKNK